MASFSNSRCGHLTGDQDDYDTLVKISKNNESLGYIRHEEEDEVKLRIESGINMEPVGRRTRICCLSDDSSILQEKDGISRVLQHYDVIVVYPSDEYDFNAESPFTRETMERLSVKTNAMRTVHCTTPSLSIAYRSQSISTR